MHILVSVALAMQNIPYKWGGNNPMVGFDCSGLVQWVLKSAGEDPPGDQSAQGLFDYFSAMGRSKFDELGPGSLVFYGKSVTQITHVAIAIDKYRIVEAASGGPSTLAKTDAELCGACVRVSLIDHRKDRVSVLKPYYRKIGMI